MFAHAFFSGHLVSADSVRRETALGAVTGAPSAGGGPGYSTSGLCADGGRSAATPAATNAVTPRGASPARVALLIGLFAPLAATAETVFRVESRDGPIQLEVHDGGATLRLRLSRPADLDASLRSLEELLTQAFPQGSFPAERVSIGVGRIIEHPWLSQRLAAAALHSPHWDPARGKPSTGNDNMAAMQIIDDGKLVAAWAPAFARYGATIRNASVEKVLVGRVGDSAELAPLAADPAAMGKRLPFDAILWLQLERTTP